MLWIFLLQMIIHSSHKHACFTLVKWVWALLPTLYEAFVLTCALELLTPLHHLTWYLAKLYWIPHTKYLDSGLSLKMKSIWIGKTRECDVAFYFSQVILFFHHVFRHNLIGWWALHHHLICASFLLCLCYLYYHWGA